jgi:hypothetical protein
MSILKDPLVSNIVNLFNLRAFRPDPFDMTATIKERFSRKIILGITIYPRFVKVAKIHFMGSGHIEMVSNTPRSSGDDHELMRILTAIASANPSMPCVIAYNFGFNALKSFSIKRSDALWMQTKDNPQRLLGDDYEAEHSYSIISHPTRENSIVFAFEDQIIRSMERMIEQSGLVCVRLHQTVATLFNHAYSLNKGIFSNNMLILSGYSLFYLEVDPTNDHDWVSMRNRSENSSASAAEAKGQLRVLDQLLPKDDSTIILVCDNEDESVNWVARLSELRPRLKTKSLLRKGETEANLIFNALIED